MSTRYLIAALLMTSACVAQADVLPSSAQSGFLSNWTTGDGSSVVASGVLSDNVSLIGGVAYGSDANAAQALYQQASASVGNAGGAVTLTYTQGIEGTYLLGTSHGVLAAMLGNGVSVVGSANGVVVSTAAAGNASVGTSSSQLASVGTGTSAAGSSSVNTSSSSTAGTSGGTSNDLGTSSSTDPLSSTPVQGTSAAEQANADAADPAAALPEPSSIALMAIGLFGAVGLRRRAK